MLNKYDLVVGLEVHVELKTKSKIFCSCRNEFSIDPNINCCEICLGMPGGLPFLNKEVVNKAIAIAKILNCNINKESYFDRKHFIYADLVKNYQTTQFEKPIAYDGYFEFVVEDTIKKVEIERIHIEEDAGKVIYKDGDVLLDYNRSGVPLVEIVTKPNFYSIDEVKFFLEQLKVALMYNDISDCKMNEGSYRFDVNISIKEKGSCILGNRTEIKNMNSFKEVVKAISKEFERQSNILDKGDKVLQQSLNWKEKTSEIVVLREKESIEGYKFIREYNLPLLEILDNQINSIVVNKLTDKIMEYVNNYKLSYKETLEIIKNKKVDLLYNDVLKGFNDYKLIRNLFIEVFLKYEVIEKTNIKSQDIILLLNYLKDNKINNTILKSAIKESFKRNIPIIDIINENNLFLINDKDILEVFVNKVLGENEKLINDYKIGKTKVLKSIIGKVIAETNGKAEPILLKEVVIKTLDKL